MKGLCRRLPRLPESASESGGRCRQSGTVEPTLDGPMWCRAPHPWVHGGHCVTSPFVVRTRSGGVDTDVSSKPCRARDHEDQAANRYRKSVRKRDGINVLDVKSGMFHVRSPEMCDCQGRSKSRPPGRRKRGPLKAARSDARAGGDSPPAVGFWFWREAESPEPWECGNLAGFGRDFQGACGKGGKPAFWLSRLSTAPAFPRLSSGSHRCGPFRWRRRSRLD